MNTDLFLRAGADRRLAAGHLWVFSNEVDVQRSPLQSFAAGDLVQVRRANGALLGSAYMEPQSLICARLYAHGREQALSSQWLSALVARALASREALLPGQCYRLIYGDSDGIPGLVVDRFGDYLVMQFHNAGIEQHEAAVIEALARVLQDMPPDAPGIVIVQHMPEGFTRAFAERLDGMTRLRVREAQDGDAVQPGLALVAPGGPRHMVLAGRAPHWRVTLVDGDPVCFSRPSVDRLFESVARLAGQQTCAALLTGMGRDGAAGLAAIRKAGGFTLAQDEATSVVWGMPSAAIELGAAMTVQPIDTVATSLLSAATHAMPRGASRNIPQEGTTP